MTAAARLEPRRGRFLLRRLAASLLLLYLVLTATFFLVHAGAGRSPTTAGGGPAPPGRAAGEPAAALRARPPAAGAVRPLARRRWRAGDWGTSLLPPAAGDHASSSRPCPATLLLAAAALLVEQAAGAALRHRGGAAARPAADHVIRVVSLLLFSQPAFWLGLMAILLFSLVWPVLPAGHMHSVGAEDLMSPGAALLDLLRHLILPALVLGLGTGGRDGPLRPGSLLEVMGQDYIRTARAKGLSERRVVWVHALRNALPPLIQVFALSCRVAAERRPDHRGHLLLAGHRPAHLRGDPEPRLPAGPRRDHGLRRRHGRPGQPGWRTCSTPLADPRVRDA